MGLAAELAEARALLARAKSGATDFGMNLPANQAATAGGEIRKREKILADAETNLERVEREVLERALAIVEERDPEYAAKMRGAKLVDEVEKHAFIGAADRLLGD
jgi:hypothetical protein